MRTWMLAVALGTLAPSVGAQELDGPRWSAWQGCWHVRMDAIRGAADAADAADVPADGAPAPRVCVTAEGDTATIITEVDGRPPLTQHLVADGAERPFAEGACAGAQQVGWSTDRRRLFARAQLTCAEGTVRTVSGVSLLAPDGTWIEAQAIEVGGRSSVRVRRFARDDRRARDPDVHRLTIDDVKEASARVAGPAIEAALVESRSTFALTARRLVELDAAGVPENVIDVMVALTYPQSFTVRPAARADRLTPFPFDVESSDPAYDWWLPTAEAGGYFDSTYFMSPFGFSYLGGYPVVFGDQGVEVVGGGRPNRGTREGRVVNGLGYTRLAPRNAQSATGSGNASSAGRSASRTATRRGYTQSAEPASGTSSSGGSSQGSSGSASSSSGSSSSGSSSGSTAASGSGRTAVDR